MVLIFLFARHPDNVFSHLISTKHSEDKKEELRQLILPHLSPYAFFDESTVGSKFFSKHSDIVLAFEKLFVFRKGLLVLENHWAGVMECSPSLGMMLSATKRLYQKNNIQVNDVIDRMLILLMGDDFDKTFTEKELLKNGYPDVTDDELLEMEL